MIALLNDGLYGSTQILSSAGIDELQRGAVEFKQWGIALGKYAMGWFTDTIGPTDDDDYGPLDDACAAAAPPAADWRVPGDGTAAAPLGPGS